MRRKPKEKMGLLCHTCHNPVFSTGPRVQMFDRASRSEQMIFKNKYKQNANSKIFWFTRGRMSRLRSSWKGSHAECPLFFKVTEPSGQKCMGFLRVASSLGGEKANSSVAIMFLVATLRYCFDVYKGNQSGLQAVSTQSNKGCLLTETGAQSSGHSVHNTGYLICLQHMS